MASLAGTWLAVVAGFGGLRDHHGQLSFHPQLPPGWHRLRFAVRWQGARLSVAVEDDEVTYSVGDDAPGAIEIVHSGASLHVRPGTSERRRVKPITPLTKRPEQPPGRAPISVAELS
jgi:trehalose/maltose hydrolase-like predicted phosphorylase